MGLKKIELPQKEYTFSDGQTVILKSPTLAQMQNIQKRTSDDIEQIKLMLIEMSDGELDKEFLGSLPINEWANLAKNISEFIGIDIKN
ncbi:hypothetical protein CPIN17260_0977 [Campylobacter pinnipediorum subsp. pinnipediorum]|uniref:Mu-like phage protein n=1 Tax=Campylobacter pinnipediorum subsp. pinnipediorum TaxID=1660067 RepID=A0AAX0L8R3_9BACT|nr:hypothetical protein [Campylobacter pinnipediorum]AQW81273.1 hypothetical protein CPIN17260_0977 [Campylobacter pinnipediorum subsp. pinnipediorum]OPA77239.1 hypothetical protein BFG04_03850 [Campylobacter pinnipediorum subsp. pinnipediorum]